MQHFTSVQLDEIMVPASEDARQGIHNNPYDQIEQFDKWDLYEETFKAMREVFSKSRAA